MAEGSKLEDEIDMVSPPVEEGYDRELFDACTLRSLSIAGLSLECGICMNVMRDPVSACEEGHGFCSSCLEKTCKDECPLCRGKRIAQQKVLSVRNVIAKLTFCMCPYELIARQAVVEKKGREEKRRKQSLSELYSSRRIDAEDEEGEDEGRVEGNSQSSLSNGECIGHSGKRKRASAEERGGKADNVSQGNQRLCEWTGNLSDLADHEQKCQQLVRVWCKGNWNGCDFSAARMNSDRLQEHEKKCKKIHAVCADCSSQFSLPHGHIEPQGPYKSYEDKTLCMDCKRRQQRMLFACTLGDLESVTSLLDEGVPVDTTCWTVMGIRRDTPLLLALKNARIQVVHVLLNRGANVTDSSHDLIEAVCCECWSPREQRDSLKCVVALAEAGAPVTRGPKCNLSCASALIDACRNDSIGIAKYLIEKGVDVDEYRKKDCTALMVAASEGNLAVCQMLVAAGADTVAHGYSVLCACIRGLDKIPGTRHVSSSEEYIRGELDNRMKCLRYFIESGVDVNHMQPECVGAWGTGETALMLAASAGFVGMPFSRFLLENGAHVIASVRNQGKTKPWGTTALMCAISCAPLLRLLVHNNAQIHARDALGNTALILAAEAGMLASVQFLVECGACVTTKNHNGQTALSLAKERIVDQKREKEALQGDPLVNDAILEMSNAQRGIDFGATVKFLRGRGQPSVSKQVDQCIQHSDEGVPVHTRGAD